MRRCLRNGVGDYRDVGCVVVWAGKISAMSADKCKQTIFRLVGAPQFMRRFGKTLMARACIDRAIIEIWYQHVARMRANAD